MNTNVDNHQKESIYSGYPTEDNVHKELVSLIKKTKYEDMKEVSVSLKYVISSYDIIRLANEYKKGNKEFNDKVEYLLNDTNFRSECSMLVYNKIDELIDNAKKEIEKDLETYVLDKFINKYKKNGNSGYLSKASKELNDVSLYDCLYLIDKGYIEKYGNGYELTDDYILKTFGEKTTNNENGKLHIKETNDKQNLGTCLKKICDKYGFKTKFSGVNDNYFCNVYAKNTDGNYVFWFDIQLSNHDSTYGKPFEPVITLRGNTDQNNIWLSDTRKDLSLKDVTDFCIMIAKICNCKLVTKYTDKPNEINIHRIVDLEDLQEFKDYVSLEDLQKYIDANMDINNKQIPKLESKTIEEKEEEMERDAYEI